MKLNYIQSVPALMAYKFCEKELKALITMDLKRNCKWSEYINRNDNLQLVYCLHFLPYRSLFHYRLGFSKRVITKLSLFLMKYIQPRLMTIEIGGVIGGGCFISHNFSVVYPKTAGMNLRIGPGVVIGGALPNRPSIGNNVYIASNATVIGNVRIGDNCIIGAGSVVVKDIPDNSVAVGNPARVIRSITPADFSSIF